MDKQKAVVIAVPMLLRGGTEIQTLALARVLREERYRVIVCCYYEFEANVVEEFQKEGAEVHRLQLRRFDKKYSYSQMITLLWKLSFFFKKIAPDIVHVQYVAPGLVPILAAKLAGVKTVFATIHYPRYIFGKREERFVHIASRLCTMFFCNSLATERSWFGTGMMYDSAEFNLSRRHCTIYNSIDVHRIEKFSGSVNRTAFKKKLGVTNKYIIGVVARLRSEKGHSFLLHAMKQVLQSAPSTTLAVIGDGPDKFALQSLAEKLHIDSNILWLGSKSQEETFQLYGVMDVVVVPSEFEGFGLSAAEAMAASLPVIASGVGGLREVVDDGKSGILVSFGDVEKMTSSLLELLSDAERAKDMGKRGKERIEQLFSFSRFQQAISRAYEEF